MKNKLINIYVRRSAFPENVKGYIVLMNIKVNLLKYRFIVETDSIDGLVGKPLHKITVMDDKLKKYLYKQVDKQFDYKGSDKLNLDFYTDDEILNDKGE